MTKRHATFLALATAVLGAGCGNAQAAPGPGTASPAGSMAPAASPSLGPPSSPALPPSALDQHPPPWADPSGARIRLAAEGTLAAGHPMFAPFKWAGVWQSRMPDGKLFHCTAQFITPRVILLAAHCVRDQDTGEYMDPTNKESTFLLQYQNRVFAKAYHALCKATWPGWVALLQPGEKPFAADWSETMSEERRKEYMKAYAKSWQWDYAFVLVDAESLTGHFNYHINERWNGATSIGYPGDLMAGAIVQRVDGDVLNVSNLSYSMSNYENMQVMWHGNSKYTQGSSGGAWVARASQKEGPDTNIVIGLNSFGNDSHAGASFGPLFTDDFAKLLEFVDGGCVPAKPASGSKPSPWK